MKLIQKYQAKDGREFASEKETIAHEQLLDKIAYIEDRYLGAKHPKVIDNEGYYQHKEAHIKAGWVEVIKLAMPLFEGFDNLIKAAKENPSNIHPMGFDGRVISGSNTPLNKIWSRFQCIDTNFREWQQPYFAINGPDRDNNKRVN